MPRHTARPPVPDLGPAPLRPRKRRLRAWVQLALVMLWTVAGCSLQAVLIRLPGRGKVRFARVFWAVICRLLRVRTRVIGAPVAGRPVIYAANHASWLDIAVLGGSLHACFVSKGDVAHWPVINIVARLGRTVFVSRARARTAQERDQMRTRLDAGDSLILFPEGTSSDGTRVLPFRSAFFSVTEGADPPLIQPVSVAYDRLGFLPVLRGNRALFGWYGDMELPPHVWGLLGRHGLRASVLLHPPLDPATFPNRKALALAAQAVVADGAAKLRQGTI